jgi:hypothetical protein
MAKFLISNLNWQNFNFENIRFERLSNDIKDTDDSEKQLRKQHNITFQAVADDDLHVEPIISNNGLVGLVDDICLLLSLPLASYVYFFKHTINETLFIGRVLHVSNAVGSLMVKHNKIEPFLNTAAKSLRQPDWAAKTRILDSIRFLRAAFCSEFVDVAFMLMQKELIINKLPELNRPSIRYKTYKLRDAYEWDFMTDGLIDDCYEFRNSFMHDGTHAGFDQRKLPDLSTRFKDSIQLALIDLLGCSSYVPDLQGFKRKIKGD